MYGVKLEEAIKLLAGTFLLLLLGLLGPLYAQRHVNQRVIAVNETLSLNVNRITQIGRISDSLIDAARQYIITGEPIYEQRYSTIAATRSNIFDELTGDSVNNTPSEIQRAQQIQIIFEKLRQHEAAAINAFAGSYDPPENPNGSKARAPDLNFEKTPIFGVAFDQLRLDLAKLTADFLTQLESRTRADLKLAESEANFWWILSVSMALGLLVACAIGSSILVVRFVRPLFTLVSTMQDLAADHEVHEIYGIHRSDEIGQMAQSMVIFQQNAEEKRILQFERERLMQRKIDDAADRFRLLFEGPEVGLLEVDYRQKTVIYNNALKRIIGKPNHWQPKMDHFVELLKHPNELDAFRRDQAIVAVGGRIVRDARIILEDGRLVWIKLCAKGILGNMQDINTSKSRSSPLDGGVITSADFQLVRLIASVEDITARKLAEENIRVSEARLAALADASQSGILELDRKTGEFYANKKYRDILKIDDHAPAASFELSPRVHPSDRTAFDEELIQAKQSGHFQAEYRVCRDDGNWIWIRDVSNLVFESGEIVRIIVGIVDISEARETQLAIQAAKAQEIALTAAAEVKDNFFAFMTHELRTPVNAISNYLQLIKEDLSESAPINPTVLEQDIDKMRFAALHLRRLVDNILDVSKIEAGRLELNLEETESAVIISEINTVAAPLGQIKGIQVATFLYDFPQKVMVDRLRLNQILFNLVSNAVKFTESGSVTIRLFSENDMLNFEVRDTGMGMSQETMAKLFDAYAQGNRAITKQHGGTGLGLALSLQLAQLMGGTIRVESELGIGSTFTLEIPNVPLPA